MMRVLAVGGEGGRGEEGFEEATLAVGISAPDEFTSRVVAENGTSLAGDIDEAGGGVHAVATDGRRGEDITFGFYGEDRDGRELDGGGAAIMEGAGEGSAEHKGLVGDGRGGVRRGILGEDELERKFIPNITLNGGFGCGGKGEEEANADDGYENAGNDRRRNKRPAAAGTEEFTRLEKERNKTGESGKESGENGGTGVDDDGYDGERGRSNK